MTWGIIAKVRSAPGPASVLAGLMKKIDRQASVTGYPDAAAIRAEEESR